MVARSAARIEVYQRLPDGGWEYREHTEGTVRLRCGTTIDIATLYADLHT